MAKKKKKTSKKKVNKKKVTKKKSSKKKSTKKSVKKKKTQKKKATSKKASKKKATKKKSTKKKVTKKSGKKVKKAKNPSTKKTAPKKAAPKKEKVATVHPWEGKEVPSIPVYDLENQAHDLKELSTQHPQLVLYFYPKDDTPGCTQESCDFRDNFLKFKDKNISVMGISPDSVESHHKFINKHNLNFPLLEDRDHQLAEALGVWKEKSFMGNSYMGIERSTFYIENGTIVKAWQPVRVNGHVDAVLEVALKND